jgi:hypothetical protein
MLSELIWRKRGLDRRGSRSNISIKTIDYDIFSKALLLRDGHRGDLRDTAIDREKSQKQGRITPPLFLFLYFSRPSPRPTIGHGRLVTGSAS